MLNDNVCANFKCFLGQGGSTLCHLLTIEERKFAFKYPSVNSCCCDDNSDWVKSQIKGQSFIKKIKKETMSNIFFPEITGVGEDFVVEEYAPGVSLTADFYNSLPKNKKDIISSNIAIFMHEVSQMTVSIEDKLNHEKANCMPSSSIEGTLFPKMTRKERAILKDALKVRDAENKENCTDFYKHGDLKPKNVLFDINTNRLSIVDFGCFGVGSKYDNFRTPNPANDEAMKGFWPDVIKKYNRMSGEKDARISTQKLKKLLIARMAEITAFKVMFSKQKNINELKENMQAMLSNNYPCQKTRKDGHYNI